ncbi:MAG: hypothetical protein IPG45_05620 [Deltaproteobacteria bacterium]|jgi:uncharacterized protein YdcH (DUF465 family)|nr:hypothetical protein [Deltaproteobacteria bacterium]
MDGMTGVRSDDPAVAAEIERLRKEHQELKARLSELNSRLYLSPEEEVERKTIQKLKLQKKDRLAALGAS